MYLQYIYILIHYARIQSDHHWPIDIFLNLNRFSIYFDHPSETKGGIT